VAHGVALLGEDSFSTNRHCERSEAIQLYRSKAGLLRRCAPRNDGVWGICEKTALMI
jgi:hypothetical protein